MVNQSIQSEVSEYILSLCPEARVVENEGDTFFFGGAEENFPFATIVSKDTDFDDLSNLARESVFRLNIGCGKETFRSMFPNFNSNDDKSSARTTDFTVIDKALPHPVYGRMHWLCILNPSHVTLENLSPVIREAHDLQVARMSRRSVRAASQKS